MSKVALAIPIVIGVVAAIFLSVYFGNNSIIPNANNAKNDSTTSEISLSDLIKRGSPRVGNSAATITIVEFGDYQCTFCYKFHRDSLDTLKKEYVDSGKVSLIFVDFPLNGPDSVLAAEATHCANEQGKFWSMHDVIYQNWKGERTGWVTRDSLDQFANSVGIDTKSLDSCLNSAKYHQKVLDTYDFAQGINIAATPSFLIISNNGVTKITGNQPLDVFRKVLDGI